MVERIRRTLGFKSFPSTEYAEVRSIVESCILIKQSMHSEIASQEKCRKDFCFDVGAWSRVPSGHGVVKVHAANLTASFVKGFF